MTIKWARVLLQFPVTFDRDGDAVLYELLEKSPFHIRLDDTAGEIDGQRVLKADNGAVGALGIRDSHINIEALQIGFISSGTRIAPMLVRPAEEFLSCTRW